MPAEHLTVVDIDDDAGDAEILRRHLDEIEELSIDLVHVATAAEAQEELRRRSFDVMFLDYHLGAETGLDLLRHIRAEGDLHPIIVLTGRGDEYVAANLMRSGADDYLVKSDLSAIVLRRAIANAQVRYRQRTIESMNRELLTALRGANESLQSEINTRKGVERQLQSANDLLEKKNSRLAELYNTAQQFVDNVSHEFRTPLTVIKEFASIIRDGLAGPLSPDQSQYLDIISDRVDDLTFMVNDMLDVSRLEAGLLSVARRGCELSEILKRVRTTLERKAAANHVRIEIDDARATPALFCDPEKIGQVIVNLTINAIKFSPEGGLVEIRAQFLTPSGDIRVSVSDNGPGIEKTDLQPIFERFRQMPGAVRSSTKGFGLGLSIARDLVHLNLGEIDVDSTPGQGSTFSFTIPTFDPALLARRYVGHVLRMSPQAIITLVALEVTEELAANTESELDRMLQYFLRPSDFLLPLGPRRWLMAVADHPRENGSIEELLEKVRGDANRNRPGAPLPPVHASTVGSFPVREEDELIAEMEREIAELGCHDAMLAHTVD